MRYGLGEQPLRPFEFLLEKKTIMLADKHIIIETRGCAGLITLNRPQALNALSLPMVRQITAALLEWKAHSAIKLVAIRGMGKNPAHVTGSTAPAFTPFGSFCAGGDIRFFHQAALTGDSALEDFFTEEYALNYLIHTYPKPTIAFMDGIVMGGGMGISQGASHRIVTERTKMAMPETGIGLFPDVGGGYFLSRCPGRVGEYLALTGQLIGAEDAVANQLADAHVSAADLHTLWDALPAVSDASAASIDNLLATKKIASRASFHWAIGQNSSKIDTIFALKTVPEIMQALEQDGTAWANETAVALRKRSPLMLHVVLELIRRARDMSLADDLRLERDLVHHCFHTKHLQRSGASSETVEGIRALAVDKDHAPRWNPARIEDVTTEMVAPFFVSPWAVGAHPLWALV
jgi:enoyl-CoA hydratase/carnithine racemase